MLQVMENAWLSLNLDAHYAHPLNRGWMAVFHRWTNAETFRRHWPVLRSEFGRGFVSFCEKQMRLGQVEGRAVRIGPPPATESYLSIPALLDAARTSGADAIHPGYGFLSERAEFARACEQANVIFTLPP